MENSSFGVVGALSSATRPRTTHVMIRTAAEARPWTRARDAGSTAGDVRGLFLYGGVSFARAPRATPLLRARSARRAQQRLAIGGERAALGRRRGDRGRGALHGPPGVPQHHHREKARCTTPTTAGPTCSTRCHPRRRRARLPRGQAPARRARSAAGRPSRRRLRRGVDSLITESFELGVGLRRRTSVQVSHVAGVAKGLVLPGLTTTTRSCAATSSASRTPCESWTLTSAATTTPASRPSRSTSSASACRRPSAPTATFVVLL